MPEEKNKAQQPMQTQNTPDVYSNIAKVHFNKVILKLSIREMSVVFSECSEENTAVCMA